jgi:rhomboid protease GluP
MAMWRSQRARSRGWWIVIFGLAAILGLGYAFWYDIRGYVAGGFWVAFALVPLLLIRVQGWLVSVGRFRLAWIVSHLARLLHPFDGWWQLPEMVRATHLMSRGQREAASVVLSRLERPNSPFGWTAKIQHFRLDHRWQDLRDWVEKEAAQQGALSEFTVAFNYLRAIGELGDAGGLLRAWSGILANQRELTGQPAVGQSLRMLVLAFLGRPEALERLLAAPGGPSDAHVGALWYATALQAAGRASEAQARLIALMASADPLTKVAATRRVAQPASVVDVAALSPEEQALLHRAEFPPVEERPHTSLHHPPPGIPVVTYALLAVNLFVFLWLEYRIPLDQLAQGRFDWIYGLTAGGSESEIRLRALGALIVPVDDWPARWPRFVTANFLHYGWLHLLMNSFGLWFFGRYLERLLGSTQFLIGYLASGIGAMIGVALLMPLWFSDESIVIGASGCVMGLVGMTAVISLRLWRYHRSEAAQQQLTMIVVLVALQTAFDYTTPQVSGTAHLGGLVIGMLFGLIFFVNFDADEEL